MYIKKYNYAKNQSFTIMQCTSYPIPKLSRFETMFLIQVISLYFSSKSYIHWHDEYNCEGDYESIKNMNDALMQMQEALEKLKPYLE